MGGGRGLQKGFRGLIIIGSTGGGGSPKMRGDLCLKLLEGERYGESLFILESKKRDPYFGVGEGYLDGGGSHLTKDSLQWGEF